MIDPTQPWASFPSESALSASEKEPAKAWEAFLAHVARIRAKPAFDVEERDYKLEIAQRLRGLLDGVRDEVARFPEAIQTLFVGSFAGRHYDLTLNIAWINEWAVNDPSSLAKALKGFTRKDATLVERFAWFVECAEETQAAGKLASNVAEVLAYGSLFNFGASPESAPIIRPWAFYLIERILGYNAGGELVPQYESHLAFAQQMKERLEAAGVPVRDAVDVQSLVWLAAQEHEYWFTPPPPEELERVRVRDASRSRGNGASGKPYVSICSIYRNEAPYLREWIEFHRLAGVEHFYLYDNASTDDHREVLAPYIEDGCVTLHEWPMFPLAQHEAYDDCLKEHASDSRWIAFIDIDEFLFAPTGQRLAEILVDYEQWPGVGANVVTFGPCGHRTKPPGLVIENYACSIAPETGVAIKSIVDPVRAHHCIDAHYFVYRYRTTVDENAFPVWRGLTKSPSYSRLRVNHYWTKSEEECRAKFARPTADDGRLRRWPDLLGHRQRDEKLAQPDEAILRFVPELKRILAKG